MTPHGSFVPLDAGDIMNPIRFKYLNLWTYTRAMKKAVNLAETDTMGGIGGLVKDFFDAVNRKNKFARVFARTLNRAMDWTIQL
jgi:hypothetical protein